MLHDITEILYEIDLDKIQTLEDMQKIFPVFIAHYNQVFSEEEAKGFKDVCVQSDMDFMTIVQKRVQEMMYHTMLYGNYQMGRGI